MVKKRVLVTGGSGFLGSHTADQLSKQGFKVVLFDNKPSKWKSPDQEMVIGDITNFEDCKKACEGVKYVFHYAGIADINESKKDPLNTIQLNIIGTANLLKASVSTKVERFVFASTMYVYSPYGSFYRATKQSSESIIEVFSEEFNLDYTFLRYGSLYGPRSQSWNGLRGYISQIINNGEIEYRGTGEEIREYLHVEDAAKLSVKILENKYKNKAITLTGHQKLSSNEMINLLFEISGKKKKIKYKKNNKDSDHYVNTPYRFSPKASVKIIPDEFRDFGEGIIEVMDEISSTKK